MATTALFRLSLGTRLPDAHLRVSGPHVVETDVSFVLIALEDDTQEAFNNARLTASQWGCAWCEMVLACDLVEVRI